jgi:hypothetical protein
MRETIHYSKKMSRTEHYRDDSLHSAKLGTINESYRLVKMISQTNVKLLKAGRLMGFVLICERGCDRISERIRD